MFNKNYLFPIIPFFISHFLFYSFLHLHRSATGTSFKASSMCFPQPLLTKIITHSRFISFQSLKR